MKINVTFDRGEAKGLEQVEHQLFPRGGVQVDGDGDLIIRTLTGNTVIFNEGEWSAFAVEKYA